MGTIFPPGTTLRERGEIRKVSRRAEIEEPSSFCILLSFLLLSCSPFSRSAARGRSAAEARLPWVPLLRPRLCCAREERVVR
jgi:hypothetical protein